MENIKKVLVLAVSPRRGGNSDTLSDEFVRGAKEVGHNVEKVFVRDKKIGYCTGCYYCEKSGGVCAIKDDMPELLEKIIAADVLVMATPVYFYCMNAQLRTVIDRTVARYTEIKDKEAYLIATAGEDEDHAVEGTVTAFRGYLECLENVREAGLVLAIGVHIPGEVKDRPYMQQAYEMGKNV
ncbi:MAG: flavodoxin family protein [Oscillospiraceae bacterium]|nr:flavodoxin family protein [Oscillospiraceae bacterium]